VKNTVHVMYECGHWTEIIKNRLPLKRSIVQCKTCKRYCHPKHIMMKEYHVRCADCRVSRWFGQNMQRAIEFVANHPHAHCVIEYDTITMDGRGSAFRKRDLSAEFNSGTLFPVKTEEEPPPF